MADNGSILTSCIIFYLSIGAAIFQILEEQNWKKAVEKYVKDKEDIRRKYNLTDDALNEILQVVSEAAGQGVAIIGDNDRNPWDWGNSLIFTNSIVTTIGYGNVAPRTNGGRIFCILYGLCGIPLCLVWVSKMGSFFGDRAKRLSGVLIEKNVSVKKVQFICIALFLLWGLLVHLVIPPFIFMSMENWTYLEGFYFCFITLTTVGFGDYVAGVNPAIKYNPIYRVLTELWIYMSLAWLSLFFSWNVHMVVDTHKVLKKKWQKHRHRNIYHEEPRDVEKKPQENARPKVVDIFSFLSQEAEDYNTIIKKIGMLRGKQAADKINRSKSCSDILAMNIQPLEHSPRHRRMIGTSEVFINVIPERDRDENERARSASEITGDPESEACVRNDDSCAIDFEAGGISFTVAAKKTAEEETVQHPDGGETRFMISKVAEEDLLDKEKG
ncbi:potassium channel subfamily K member 5-like [Archocentrus centrarchus]|uniref:potassium channel subfamily K member 5-like n=1 Tax=Archocentrus centrarchus TaxID=63155 RepID=UPI0011EA0A71|nr:potassium channel subfamily K member 5-like [Archocentrus centrarchus]